MVRLFSLSIVCVLLLATYGVRGKLDADLPVSQEIPKTAIVEIILLSAPGINEAGSRWEIAYEFRIATEATLWQAWKQGKFDSGSQEPVGELIKEDTFKELLRSPENRRARFQIPLSTEVQERLRNQPREFVKITPGRVTPEDARLLREYEMKAQVFMFYPTINIYDAKLKKNIMILFPQSWDFHNYPQARFEIKVEIKSDGNYNVDSYLPTRKRSE
jgi:hypothetical protein